MRLSVRHFVHPGPLSAWLHHWGRLGPLLFVVLLTVRPLTLLPGQLLCAIGGMLFGTVWGATYAMLGSFGSTLVVYGLAQRLGSPLLKRIAGDHYSALARAARAHDFPFMVLATINPLVPTDMAVAAAAASRSRFWPTALGVLVGTIPGTILTAQFGSALGRGKTILTGVSAAGMLVSLVLGVVLGRRVLGFMRADSEGPEALAPPGEPRHSAGHEPV